MPRERQWVENEPLNAILFEHFLAKCSDVSVFQAHRNLGENFFKNFSHFSCRIEKIAVSLQAKNEIPAHQGFHLE
jgi:hypothetical protein